MPISQDNTDLLSALTGLREAVRAARFTLPAPEAVEARQLRRQIRGQLDNYVLPRLREIDAPLLAVVGGSTGAGKSTLVNALVGRRVTDPGVLRPTTRSPVLVVHPDDSRWFESGRVFPGLPRIFGGDGSDIGGLHIVPEEAVPAGLALLDAPDIDSVVTQNRELAAQLLAAADLWLFVTSAARYADAVPWDLLSEAAERSAAVAVVLDRVPPEAADEVRDDLAQMLTKRGLADAPLFVVPEVFLTEGDLLPLEHVREIRDWLHGLAADAAARAEVVRRTLEGAIANMVRRVSDLAVAADAQAVHAKRLVGEVDRAYDEAFKAVEAATRDGVLLRGEVLARWQEFVGTGELFRSLEAKVGRMRDRIAAALRGRPQPGTEVGEAIESTLETLLITEGDGAAERAEASWRSDAAGAALLEPVELDLSRSSPEFPRLVSEQMRAWQGAVLDLVRAEGQDKRATARFLSFGVNGVGLALMIVVFSATGGLTGVEVGVAGGTAVLGQRLLEAIFGDQAVRRLAATARADLQDRVTWLYEHERQRYASLVDRLNIDPQAGSALRAAAAEVARAGEGGRNAGA